MPMPPGRAIGGPASLVPPEADRRAEIAGGLGSLEAENRRSDRGRGHLMRENLCAVVECLLC